MNRALLIILIPAILVALGYILVFRLMGLSPGYPRFIVGGLVFVTAAYWLWPRKANSGAKDRE